MEKQNRLNLRSKFRTGDRPTQEDFENVFESYLNFEDDGISIDNDQNLEISGSLTIGDQDVSATDAGAGTVRWHNNQFEGSDGTSWGPLGGGDSPWAAQGDDLVFSTGNVGIGTGITNPAFPLEVNLDNAAPRVKFGLATMGIGPVPIETSAIFSHAGLTTQRNYAMRQDSSGSTYINCPTGQRIEFRSNNSAIAGFHKNKLVIGRATEIINDATHRLQVDGVAYKSDGEPDWDTTSDIRVKKDVKPFKDGLQALKKIHPISFKYNGKGNTKEGLEGVSVSAQELEKIYPNMVKRIKMDTEKSGLDTPEVLTINTSRLKYVMLNAIKELESRIKQLEANQKVEPSKI
ncbi:MAG: tail fiber domain-containing protein [Bacteroidota bacterium]